MMRIAFLILMALTAGAAHAALSPNIVPEIDALSGLSALAVVGCVAALYWERRRK